MFKSIWGWLRRVLRRGPKAPLTKPSEWDLIPYEFAIDWYVSLAALDAAYVTRNRRRLVLVPRKGSALADAIVSTREGT